MSDAPGPAALLDRLERLLGPGGLLRDPAARLVYARDASHLTLGRPLAVALPADAETLGDVLRCCAAHGVAVVTRGTGTGLSGGAVPNDGEVVLSTARLNSIDAVNVRDGRVRSGVGMLNDRVSAHSAACALHFAPDPSSQSAASIGGNIAENAGGPHCLRHGVTRQHLLRLEWSDAAGRAWSTGRGTVCERGIDLCSLLCGSEGTLGVITAADLKLVANPPAVATLAAFFPELDDATRSVVSLLGDGLLPVAVEMVDQPMLEAVEAAFGFGFPTDVAAAMILEFAGRSEEIAEDADRARTLLLAGGAREIRLAEDETTRLELWKCRKKAFGAVGRLAPRYVTMDVVVPLGQLPDIVREIQEIKTRHGVEIATAFHAGDGNLHPGVHYDDRDPRQEKAAHAAADEIMKAALARGGSVTGEHGVGIEKLHAAPWQLDPVALDLLWAVKDVFDPAGRLNPGKALPARGSAVAKAPSPPRGMDFRWDSLTVTAAADVSLAELQSAALARGLWVPVGLAAPGPTEPGRPGLGTDQTVGSVIEHSLYAPILLAGGSARDSLLELWAETGEGRLLHAGAPVVKNVVGYGLAQSICGSGRVLAVPRAATFQLRPAPESLGLWLLAAANRIDKLSAAIEPFLRLLAERDPGLGGPLGLIEEAPDGRQSVSLLAPGRDRDWDLGELDAQVKSTAAQFGFEIVRADRRPIASWASVLPLLPAWALAGEDWTAWLRLPGGPSDANLGPASRPGRMIWQSAPRVVWVPGLDEAPEHWHADPCCRAGRPCALPEPDPDVPLPILRGLKKVFDPLGALDCPAWLREAPHD